LRFVGLPIVSPTYRADMKETLIETLDINEPEDFVGAYAIIFGWCKKSSNDKLYIQVMNRQPCHIFVKLV